MERTRRLRTSNYMRDMVRKSCEVDEADLSNFCDGRRRYQTSC